MKAKKQPSSRSPMSSRGAMSTRSAMSLIAGAGVGVALMYLLDPKNGAQRRGALTNRAKRAAVGAQDLASQAWENMSHHAADALDAAREHAGDFPRISAGISEHLSGASQAAQSLFKTGQATASKAHDKAADLMDRAAAMKDSATDMLGNARHRANIALGREREHHYMSQSACALGSLVLGAGLAWMFDPRLGHSRRAWLRDKSMHWLREVGDMSNRTGRHLRNKLKGTAARTRRMTKQYLPSVAATDQPHTPAAV
jgi:hypothetical protein